MTSDKYVKAAIQNVEAKLKESGQRLPSRCVTPMSSGYRPEVDTSEELTADGRQYFQELVGVLRWAIEIG
jgi:hypothetical protein